MEIKTFKEREKEAKKMASLALEQIKEEGMQLPVELSKIEDILDNTHGYVENSVIDIANMVEGIKDVGLNANNPAVNNWIEKELEVTPEEFNEFLDGTKTGEEAKISILEEMDVPKSIIEEVKKPAKSNKKIK